MFWRRFVYYYTVWQDRTRGIHHMTDAIRQTKAYVRKSLIEDYPDRRHAARYEHTLRVATIAKMIARDEQMSEEALYLAGLLHDIGYIECHTDDDYKHHGAISARLARRFLSDIGYDPALTDTIGYGIEIHTEDEASLPRQATPFELSVADADNIDRFDMYRLALTLADDDFSNKTTEQITALCHRRIGLYSGYKNMAVGTATARRLWDECLDLQLSFYERLLAQMNVTHAADMEE